MTSSILSERLHHPGNPFLGRPGHRDVVAGFELGDDFFTSLFEIFVILGAVAAGLIFILVGAVFALAVKFSLSK